MTAYELLDVRAAISEMYMTSLRFWMTITLASFGAGNFIDGPDRLINFGLLLVFYTSSNIGIGFYQTQLGKEILAVEKDIVALTSETDGGQNIVMPDVIQSRFPPWTRNMQTASIISLPIILAGYFYSLYVS